jgi:phosphorylase superfamily protein
MTVEVTMTRHTVRIERNEKRMLGRDGRPHQCSALAARVWHRGRARATALPTLPCSVVALVGLAFEARVAAGPGVLVVCRGPDISTTLEAAFEAGCRGIISFGVAGGLAPDLRPGHWIVASEVLDGQVVRPTNSIWSRNLLETLPEVRYGRIVGVPAPVADPLARRAIPCQDRCYCG